MCRSLHWLGYLQRKSRQEKPMHATLSTKGPHFHRETVLLTHQSTHPPLSLRLSFYSMMWGVRLLLLFLQVSLFPTTQAASPPLPLQRNPISLREPTDAAIASNRGDSLINPGNELRLFFSNLGDPIPAAEVRHTLAVANANVQAHLPRYAHERISRDLFETNTTFPETGDSIYFWVYSYGYGLSWLQLSQALGKLQNYMLGIGPDHPPPHCQELEFYVQLTPWMEVARGVVEFTPGARRATAKLSLVTTTTLQLTQANISSPSSNADLPINFHVATNLDINVTRIGLPIPEPIVLAAIEEAWVDVMLNHTDIDATVPRNKFPYSFNHTTGKLPHLFTTEISISQYPGKKMYWGLLCLLYYGVRDFMVSTKYFNVMKFEILDAKLGKLGFGTVLYGPDRGTASNVLLTSE